MRRLVVLIVLLCAPLAFAGTVSWTLPTQYVDNTVIAPADVAALVTEVQSSQALLGPWSSVGTSALGASLLTATTQRNRYYQARTGWPSDNVWSDYCSPFLWGKTKGKPPVALSVSP